MFTEKEMDKIVNDLKDDGVSISLMLTNKCNFECDHCMYSCSPRRSGQYMDRVTLRKVIDWAKYLDDLDIRTTINFIGGEPTLNMTQFKNTIEYMSKYDDILSYEMTTNGWWLEKPGSAYRFFEAIKPLWEDMRVRISDDKFHRRFRKRSIKQTYKDLCYTSFSYVESCGYDEYEYLPPEINNNDPWLYLEDDLEESGVNVRGRGINAGYKDRGGDGGCTYSNKITISPTGVVTDICCVGSNTRLGKVEDNIISLLLLSNQYMKKHKPKKTSCMDCDECVLSFRRSVDFKRAKIAYTKYAEKISNIE